MKVCGLRGLEQGSASPIPCPLSAVCLAIQGLRIRHKRSCYSFFINAFAIVGRWLIFGAFHFSVWTHRNISQQPIPQTFPGWRSLATTPFSGEI
jgi:hypothetical protein